MWLIVLKPWTLYYWKNCLRYWLERRARGPDPVRSTAYNRKTFPRDLINMVPCIKTQFIKMTKKIQLCGTIYCPLIALHVSNDTIAHHQELLNCVYTASGDTYVRHWLQFSWENQHWAYCPFIALHVPTYIIANNQEILNSVFTASGDTYVRHCLSLSWENQNCIFVPSLPYTFRAILSPIIRSL
jgi:hypothetical protein